MLSLARLETSRGRVGRSRELLDRAAETFEAQRFPEGVREIEVLRGVDAWLAGDEPLARRALAGARNRAASAGNDVAACRAALPLSRIDLASGNASAALEGMNRCLEPLALRGLQSDLATARAITILASTRLGDRARAGTLLPDALESLATEEDFAARAITRIAVEAARGRRPSSMIRLATEAREASMAIVELDALLAAAEFAAETRDRKSVAEALARAAELAKRRELQGYLRLIDAARASGAR
jgi:uncharacterized protein YfaS (alpha-2-macroglobulin family)